MPSAIETYHEKKLALVAASTELAILRDKLSAVVDALTIPTEAFKPRPIIRYPIKDDGSVDYPVDNSLPKLASVDVMPEHSELRTAIAKLIDAKREFDRAFAALSEVEKRYVTNNRNGDDEDEYGDWPSR